MKHFQIIAISVLGHGSVSPDHGSNHVETAQLRIWRLFKGVNWYPKCYTSLLHFPIQCYCKYPAEVVPYRNPSPGLCLRDWSLFIVLGGGGGGGRGFFATTEHLRDPPLQHTVWLWSPHIGGGRFHESPPPLLSQPPQKANVTIRKQVTSILMILTSHEPWTTTSHIWSSDMHWIVCEGLLFSSKSLKTKSLSLSSSSLSNSSSYS